MALKLFNPAKDLEFAGKTYKVRNANLEKISQFQEKFDELSKAADPAMQSKLASYALYLILLEATPTIENLTEAWVAQNSPNVELADVVEEFDFMNRQKVEVLRALTAPRNAPVQETGKQSST